MNDFETEVVDRLARVETKQDDFSAKLDAHLEAHSTFTSRLTVAIIVAIVALIFNIL